ncbi:MAG TPA: histidine kinase [Chloroflexota bacterium]|nr:histidine kinase [Chloroflexota bacterium]HUM67530.1 histidine kinase [Chloroflexota bacterium]
MWRQTFNVVLYRYRAFLSLSLLATTLYFVYYTWLTLPPLTLFLGWQPDTELRVLQLVEEGYDQYVQPGDLVLAIDGRPAQRGQAIFIPPVRSVYELTLQRGQVVFSQEVPVSDSPLFWIWQVSTSILALAIWFIGFMTAQFARPGQSQAIYVGLGFQLIAAGIVSPGPTQLGAPGAWLVGHVLIFYFPLIMLSLAFVPRQEPLAGPIKRVLYSAFFLLTGLAVAAAVEELLLFPERSFQDVTDINLVAILTVLAGASMISDVGILLVRLRRSDRHSYERQQLAILLTFLTLAVLPMFFFVILPLRKVIFVPFPFVYSLFLLAPAGYFFVLHRHGHLALDTFFSRVITVIVLILAIGMAYTTGVYLLDAVFHIPFNITGQGGFVLVLFGVAITCQKHVQSGVELLLYGRDLLNHDAIQSASARLAANPEPATVDAVVADAAAHLHVPQTAVLGRDGEQYRWLAGNTSPFPIPFWAMFHDIWLRSRDAHMPIDLPAWVELVIPIQAHGNRLGLLLLSRPAGGYFNARQVETLEDLADILGLSLLVMDLVEAMDELSQQALYEKELQRRQIATEIHNEPLHTLTTLSMQLQTRATDEMMQKAVQEIRHVTHDLRRIISGLRPPVLKESIEWIARAAIREFDETHDGIAVTTQLHISSSHQASEQTKLAFYYILTETMNNVSKHAAATAVDIMLCYDEKELVLEVKDNGVGGGEAMLPFTGLLREHHTGVTDMHRWASIAGGKLELRANQPSGTVVHLKLPAVPTTNP